jgi:hypothetical protein
MPIAEPQPQVTISIDMPPFGGGSWHDMLPVPNI